ncbi:MAG: DUF1684 domain-containing protein [Anaerolineales bacterium]|nr:DUF1684 domain-containing protein [Anaerolineales bacterium]
MTQRYIKELQDWRAELNRSIRNENGWLALAGLFWVEEGDHSIGRSPNCDFVLHSAEAPEGLGVLTRRGQTVSFEAGRGVTVEINGHPLKQAELTADTDPDPDFLTYNDLRFVLIKRGSRIGLRYWDNSRKERVAFPDRSWYPVQPEYRLPAQFRQAEAARTIQIPDVLGDSTEETVLGEIQFEFEGTRFSLHALEAGEGRALVLFGDETNGRGTYPGGRFLVVDLADGEQVWLDFNRAYNPPCAFTPYATCPLPPPVNRLPVEIAAGERYISNPDPA